MRIIDKQLSLYEIIDGDTYIGGVNGVNQVFIKMTYNERQWLTPF